MTFSHFVLATSIAGLVWVGFDRIEKVAGDNLRKKIRFWLISPSIDCNEILPQSSSLLDRFFGEKHFKWRCIWRSSVISSLSFFIILFWMQDLIWFILELYPREAVSYIYKSPQLTFSLIVFIVWAWVFCANLVSDYFSLLESRWVLYFIKPTTSFVVIFALLVFDLIATIFIFLVGYTFSGYIILGTMTNFYPSGIAVGSGNPDPLYTMALMQFTSIFTTFTTSIWIWGYVVASLVLKFLAKLEPLKRLTLWLDIQNQPVRAIGTVVSGFAFLISVGVGLVVV